MDSSPAPPPPTRAVLAAVLAQAADSEPLVADRPVAEISHGLQRVDLANGWQLVIWWVGGRMGPLHQASGPQGEQWTYGCDRWPDWSAGPEAVALDPLVHLLEPEQRQRLQGRLEICSCWPAPDPLPLPPPITPEQWRALFETDGCLLRAS